MTYETYTFLQKLLAAEKKKLQDDYLTASHFIPLEVPKSGEKSGIEKAHKIFSEDNAKLDVMIKELHSLAASQYKNHPNQQMREFWGLK